MHTEIRAQQRSTPLLITVARRAWTRRLTLQAALCLGGLFSAIAPAGLVGLAGSTAALSPGSALASTALPPQGRVIVRFRNNASVLAADAGTVQPLALAPQHLRRVRHAGVMGGRFGLRLVDGRTIAQHTQVMTVSGMSSADLAARLASDPDVEFAVTDHRRFAHAAPNDLLYPNGLTGGALTTGQWYLRAPVAPVTSSVDAEAAWAVTRGSASVVVAVLDTGVRPDHPDLVSKLVPGYDFIHTSLAGNDGQQTSAAPDGNADSDPSDPGDWITQADINNGIFGSGDCVAASSSWHGTLTAGLVGAATNNGVGMASLGRNVQVMPVRVLGRCGGFDSDIIAAIQWSAGIHVDSVPDNQNPARVINLSLGSPGSCDTNPTTNPTGADTAKLYVDAIAAARAKGAAVVVSAGNDQLGVNLPANCPGAIGVGAVTHVGTKARYSSLGPEIAITAPGGDCPSAGSCSHSMISTINDGTTVPANNGWSIGRDREEGTSFSAPLVAAAAALMFSADPRLSVADMLTLMQGSARAFANTGKSDPSAGTPSVCQAPGRFSQPECYCTTPKAATAGNPGVAGTCGTGMLDAGAALRAIASRVTVAAFTATPDYPKPGASVDLDASGIRPPASSGVISSYQWKITDGANVASFAAPIGSSSAATSATTANGATATLNTTGQTGFVTVQLTVTDNAGTHDVSQRIAVGNVSSNVTSTSAAAKTGGGALTGMAWLAGLLLGVLALARVRRHTRH